MDRKWFKENFVAVAALLLSFGSGAYAYVKDSSVESYNVRQLMSMSEERQQLNVKVVQMDGDIDSLRAYSINHNKRLDVVEQNLSSLISDQKVTNEILKNMTQVSQELSVNVKELTKVVERVARLEERVRVVEDDERAKDAKRFERGR